jgi:hypothetical protein
MRTPQATQISPLEYLAVSLEPQFVHRNNGDGTIDSFCRKCFKTVAWSYLEAVLEPDERNHKCDPAQLEFLNGVLDRTSKR